MRKKLALLTILLAACLVVSGCGPSAEQRATMTAAAWTATPSQTATPTQTITPSPTTMPFDFDEDAILAKLIAIFDVPPDRGAFFTPYAQYETMLLGHFIIPASPDSEGPGAVFFIATQIGNEITIDTRNTEAFSKKLEILYAAGAIDQDWYSILK